MARPRFDPAEFMKTLERMTRNQDAAFENPKPDFDAKLHREVVAQAVRGRRIEDYKQVLSAFGFLYFPAGRLPPFVDGSRRKDGEWRSARLQMAFTENDILANYSGAEDFAKWCERQVMQKRAAKAGIVLPK